jgi:hypothetical protein
MGTREIAAGRSTHRGDTSLMLGLLTGKTFEGPNLTVTVARVGCGAGYGHLKIGDALRGLTLSGPGR